MYRHEVFTKKNGKNESYNICLVKTHYFMRKKITDVVEDVDNLEDAKTLTKMLDVALQCGMNLAKGE